MWDDYKETEDGSEPLTAVGYLAKIICERDALAACVKELEALNGRLKALVRNARVITPESMGLRNIYLIDGVDWDRLQAAVEREPEQTRGA